MIGKNITELTETQIYNAILTQDLTQNGVKKIIEALKMKKYITSAILPQTPQSETFGHFLERFWDFDKSPYFFEKRVVGQSVHRRYAEIMRKRARTYYPRRRIPTSLCQALYKHPSYRILPSILSRHHTPFRESTRVPLSKEPGSDNHRNKMSREIGSYDKE